ncbi:MAG: DNA polymerase III subunit delta [Pseudomonadota bacterium]
MKLSKKEQARVFKDLGTQLMPLLVYGTDAGGVSDVVKQAQQAILAGAALDPTARVIIGPDILNDDPARVLDECAQPSFFGDTKIVHVGPVTDRHAATLAAAVEGPRSAHLLIEAGPLGPRSKLRLYFESSKEAWILPVYADGTRDIDTLVQDILIAQGVALSNDARHYLRAALGADRALSRMEIEKLALYAGAGTASAMRQLDLDTVAALIGDSSAHNSDEIAAAAFSGLSREADTRVQKALTQGIHGIEIVRALARRCIRLMLARSKLEGGQSLDGALKALRPPVFWKDKPAFSAQLNQWSTAGLDQCMLALNQAEYALKTNASSAEATLGRTVLRIARALRHSRPV